MVDKLVLIRNCWGTLVYTVPSFAITTWRMLRSLMKTSLSLLLLKTKRRMSKIHVQMLILHIQILR